MESNHIKTNRLFRQALIRVLFAALFVSFNAAAQIRDGDIDPKNLGKGVWIYSMTDATNKLGGHIQAVTNETSLMLFYKSVGIRYFIVKIGTSDKLFNGCYATPQLTSNLVNTAHQNGILIFGYNRSYGSNIVGEVAIANYVFNTGADGFVFDAEAEWETGASTPWITNGSAQAWQLCSTVRSNWPNKFLAHAPFAIINVHATFPYKEFGYWCDAVMPQMYHFSSAGIKGSPSATINWADVNWNSFHSSLRSMPNSNINGTTVVWTNAIKPIIPLQDVYGNVVSGGIICESPEPSVYADKDVMEFMDYAIADPNCPTAGGYKGANYWRADTIGSNQWNNISTGSAGYFSNIISSVVMDDFSASVSGGWNSIRVFGATTTSPTYYGATGSDTNCFGTNYLSKAQGIGNSYVRFVPNVLIPGNYDVFQWHPYVTNASSTTPFTIVSSTGTNTLQVNQQTNNGNWSLLGRFNFNSGTNGSITISDNIADSGNVAIADAVKLVYATGGVILDNTNPQVAFSGTWTLGTTATGRYQADYSFSTSTGSSAATPTAMATYVPNLPNSGYYNVYIWYPQGVNRATNAPWQVNYFGGSVTTNVNQQINGGGWQLIAAYKPFVAGTNGYVRLANNASASIVMADAVQFTYQAPMVPISFQSVRMTTNGAIQLSITGTPGYPLYVDRSTNLLQSWQIWTNFLISNSTATIFDPASQTNVTGFYRARQ
jgi:hypothetical protein